MEAVQDLQEHELDCANKSREQLDKSLRLNSFYSPFFQKLKPSDAEIT
jgi:hypothetical protein